MTQTMKIAAYNQNQKLLFHMANSKSGITRQDAMVNLGIANVTARISDLDNMMFWSRLGYGQGTVIGQVGRTKLTHPATGQTYMRYRLSAEQRNKLVAEGFLVKGVDGVYYPTNKVKTW
ncbi:MAG: hypothetical protein KKE29_20060 [Proteobacteria bacterium]|nr:hypothetical protein [Pseudomonadota bacterium]MBU4576018.1 hypothetical protein [Pseudomonadota bacterium]MBV1715984.1 hypothetical protein [Desulfarculus sp.]